jgi:hypothetical protein
MNPRSDQPSHRVRPFVHAFIIDELNAPWSGAEKRALTV